MGVEVEEPAETAQASGLGLAALSVGIGSMVGWLSSRRQQVASAAGAAALAVAPAAGLAIVDYDAVKYLGGTDKVDLNNANVQAYRQFPGMYPTAAGWIATHGPYKQVSDLYEIPGLPENVKAIMKKYEGQFVVLPANEAYLSIASTTACTAERPSRDLLRTLCFFMLVACTVTFHTKAASKIS